MTRRVVNLGAALARVARLFRSFRLSSALIKDISEIPRELFDADWYLEQYPDAPRGQTNAFRHYVEFGCREGRFPSRAAWERAELISEIFDTDWYAWHNRGVASAVENPVRHFLEQGRFNSLAPSREVWQLKELLLHLFDSEWYMSHYRDVGELGDNPLKHYIEHGRAEGRATSRASLELRQLAEHVFDREWYAAQNPDVILAGYDPLEHYLRNGLAEGRFPSRAAWQQAALAQLGSEAFDSDWYAAHNPDVMEAGLDPLQHYLEHGRREGRPAKPQWDDPGDTPQTGRDPVCWYFIGDTIEWIAKHAHLTGVGRVTSEILFAGLASHPPQFLLCTRDENPSGLGRLQNWKPIADLAELSNIDRAGLEISKQSAMLFQPSAEYPLKGDHVIFTGVVWTAAYSRLFRRLVRRGVTFSVLVNDIIPILQPELVSEDHARSFSNWLADTIQTASVIFTSTQAVAEDIARWVVCSRLDSAASIRSIDFGHRSICLDSRISAEISRQIDVSNFVLSVGTIDKRKNQLFLCSIWRHLVNSGNFGHIPQLVLVGRDDIDLPHDETLTSLFHDKKIVILNGLNDTQVSALYRACLFTIFPSTSEGYGLPVAESLSYGKLCVSSNLPVVRSHAGDLAWYFDPTSQQDAFAQITQVLLHPEKRIAAEARIRAEYRPVSWAKTAQSIAASADHVMRGQGAVGGDMYRCFESPGLEVVDREAVAIAAGSPKCEIPSVSIIITNRNSASVALDCVRRIWAQTQDVSYEIIIVDNGSDESDLRRLQILAPVAALIDLGCDRFAGESCNIAAERARGPYLCFLDATVDVEDGWLQVAMQTLQDDRTAAVVKSFTPRYGFAGRPGSVRAVGAVPWLLENGHYGVQEASFGVELTETSSAAVLIVEREAFLTVGGFDLAYEPGLYEDIDLCLKIQASGRKVIRKEGLARHRDGASNDAIAGASQLIRRLNWSKLQARWGKDLRGGERSAPVPVPAAPPVVHDPSTDDSERGLPRAILYTPYPLTPGGGERYLLSMAALLTRTHAVTLALPHLYSKLRIVTLGAEFGLDLRPVSVELVTDALVASQPEILISMNNQIVPAIAPFGKKNFFICQFPFPMQGTVTRADKDKIAGYEKILAYSRYAALHIESKMHSLQAADVPICLVPPPVTPMRSGVKRPNTIMTVGRFFVGGHAKRHDALIEAFKALRGRFAEPVELHVVGSTTPLDMHMAYLQELMRSSAGYPIHFHVNIQAEALEDLYASTAVYWHGAGLDVDLAAEPWAAEHFGISVVEAMTAGVVPFALASGGPREIIRHGVDGFLYDSLESLVDQTVAFLGSDATRRDALSATSRRRGEDFSPEVFADTVRRAILEEVLA